MKKSCNCEKTEDSVNKIFKNTIDLVKQTAEMPTAEIPEGCYDLNTLNNWPEINTIGFVADIDIKYEQESDKFKALSTLIYGTGLVICAVYQKQNNNELLLIPPSDYTFDNILGNIRIYIELPQYDRYVIYAFKRNYNVLLFKYEMFNLTNKTFSY